MTNLSKFNLRMGLRCGFLGSTVLGMCFLSFSDSCYGLKFQPMGWQRLSITCGVLDIENNEYWLTDCYETNYWGSQDPSKLMQNALTRCEPWIEANSSISHLKNFRHYGVKADQLADCQSQSKLQEARLTELGYFVKKFEMKVLP